MSPAGLGPENECAGAIVNDRLIFSSERMLHKDYDNKCSVEKNVLVVSLKALVAKINCLVVNRQS
jgi:hypothetical protein